MIVVEEFFDNFLVGTNLTKDQSQYAKLHMTKDDYTYTDNLGCFGVVEGPEIIYKINSDGFRSNHFKHFNPEIDNILFAGCSVTLGEGLPEDLTWYKQLSDKISIDSFYNVSSTGASTRLIVKNILTFIRKHGSPKFIFALFPDFARDLQYDPISKQIISCLVHPQWITAPKKFITHKVYTLNYHEEYGAFNSIENIRILEDVCNYLGIKLIWSTWSKPASDILEKVNFRNYLKIDVSFDFNNKDSVYNSGEVEVGIPYWSVAQDGIHPGSGWNREISRNFLNEFIRRGYDKQN
jgi:hypothetical protein